MNHIYIKSTYIYKYIHIKYNEINAIDDYFLLIDKTKTTIVNKKKLRQVNSKTS